SALPHRPERAEHWRRALQKRARPPDNRALPSTRGRQDSPALSRFDQAPPERRRESIPGSRNISPRATCLDNSQRLREADGTRERLHRTNFQPTLRAEVGANRAAGNRFSDGWLARNARRGLAEAARNGCRRRLYSENVIARCGS